MTNYIHDNLKLFNLLNCFPHSTDLNVRAVHGTLVVFLQNNAGFAKWEPTTERLRELLLAYRPTEPPRQ